MEAKTKVGKKEMASGVPSHLTGESSHKDNGSASVGVGDPYTPFPHLEVNAKQRWVRPMERNEEFKVISTYTREQAIEDGQLVDVSETSEVKEAGFKVPVCFTRALWHKIDDYKEDGQDTHGRLWDVCFLSVMQFRKDRMAGKDCRIVEFKVKFYEDNGLTRIWLVFNEHEGFTIMFPSDY